MRCYSTATIPGHQSVWTAPGLRQSCAITILISCLLSPNLYCVSATAAQCIYNISLNILLSTSAWLKWTELSENLQSWWSSLSVIFVAAALHGSKLAWSCSMYQLLVSWYFQKQSERWYLNITGRSHETVLGQPPATRQNYVKSDIFNFRLVITRQHKNCLKPGK